MTNNYLQLMLIEDHIHLSFITLLEIHLYEYNMHRKCKILVKEQNNDATVRCTFCTPPERRRTPS